MRVLERGAEWKAVWEGEHTCERCSTRFELDGSDRDSIIWWEERGGGCGFDFICPGCNGLLTVHKVDDVIRVSREWCEYPDSPEYYRKGVDWE